MQHDHVLKKSNFDLLTPLFDWGSASKIFATMFLHLWFPLIWKAFQKLNVLKRLIPFLSRPNKLTIFILLYYLILITTHLPGIFVLKVTLKDWRNQECALRFVYNNFKSTYEDLLNKANIPFLHIKRIRTMVVETFRILNDMTPPDLSEKFQICSCRPVEQLSRWFYTSKQLQSI